MIRRDNLGQQQTPTNTKLHQRCNRRYQTPIKDLRGCLAVPITLNGVCWSLFGVWWCILLSSVVRRCEEGVRGVSQRIHESFRWTCFSWILLPEANLFRSWLAAKQRRGGDGCTFSIAHQSGSRAVLTIWLFLAIAWAFLSRFWGSFWIFYSICARNLFLHPRHDYIRHTVASYMFRNNLKMVHEHEFPMQDHFE